MVCYEWVDENMIFTPLPLLWGGVSSSLDSQSANSKKQTMMTCWTKSGLSIELARLQVRSGRTEGYGAELAGSGGFCASMAADFCSPRCILVTKVPQFLPGKILLGTKPVS
jgi:hypothetical protein